MKSFDNEWLHDIDDTPCYRLSSPERHIKSSKMDSNVNNKYLPGQSMIKCSMRGEIVLWLFRIGSFFRLSNITVHMAISLLDILLWQGQDVFKKSVSLSIKTYENLQLFAW